MYDEDEDLIEPIDREEEGLSDTVRDAHDTIKGVDKDWKDLKKHRKAGKTGKGAQGAEKQAAEKQAAKTAEKQAAKTAAKRAAVSAGTRVAAEAAIGVATSGIGLILAIPDLIRLLKSKWGKWGVVGICAFSCLPWLILLTALIGLVVLVGGQTGDANNNCPAGDIKDWSYEMVEGNKECYLTALENASEKTNVPIGILAAIDYRDAAHGYQDNREGITHEQALIEIGKEVQKTNQARDKKTGELILDESGNPINTVSADSVSKENPNIFAGISIMSNYRCEAVAKHLLEKGGADMSNTAEVAKSVEEFCYKSTTGVGNSSYIAVQDPWLMDKFIDESIANQIETAYHPGDSYPVIGTLNNAVSKILGTQLRTFDWLKDLPGKFIDAACKLPGGGACEKPEIGAATWLKIYLAGDELRKDHTAEESGTREDIKGCDLNDWKANQGTPGGGIPPDCNRGVLSPGELAVCAAAAQLGESYVWGAPDRSWQNPNPSAFDCSGLTGWSWYHATGKDIGGTTWVQYENCANHPDGGSLQPGDLIFFYPGNTHVGIYEGNDTVIHASSPEVGIIRSSLSISGMPIYGYCRP